MKITVEIDCTPDEARRFLGLPNVALMQEAVIAKLQERITHAVDSTTPEALMKAWLPMVPDQMQWAVANLFGTLKAGTATEN